MKNLKKALYSTFLLSAVLSFQTVAQQGFIFPKGEKAANVHHIGDVWLSLVSGADSIFQYGIAEATFAPGARLNWHIHPGGQQLLITDGVGYYQERGKPMETVHKGDVIKCQPGVEHWHASTPDSWFTYIALTAPQPTKWLEQVPDEVYFSRKSESSTLTTEQELIELSKQKWQWMADKNVDELAKLFHDDSKFVHMSGTWNKARELEIIKTGSIWYKQADVHDVAVEISDDTGVLWNRITLSSNVRGNDVTVEFTVTEVYKKQADAWKLLALTFSSVRDTHEIEH